MVKRFKHARAALSPAVLEERVRRALQDNRTQAALELARQLGKVLPGPAQQELLRQAYLARARQLRQQGHTRDAAIVLASAGQVPGDAAWSETLAEELAASGQVAEALRLLEPVHESAVRPRVLARAVDAALQQGPGGGQLLPEALRPQFNQVVQAFAHAEAGRDEEARAALQEIGLQSPFLEWKILLRGLLAYYHNDDVRALENWQRLRTDGLPARVAAPFRFLIDPAFRAAQPPQTQNALQRQMERLQGESLIHPLRLIQAALAREDLSAAFRQAENCLPTLRGQAPHLVPRLASCFYWSVVRFGKQDDVPRYARLFGRPADDPQLARLEALALEEIDQLQDAHRQWQRVEQAVSDNPAAWPAGQVDRVRALIWTHMGRNAASVPDFNRFPNVPAFIRDHPDRPRALDPSAEKCFRRSLELAPDQLEPYEALLDYYLDRDQDANAEKTARKLLEQFPEHGPTLENLADLVSKRGRHAEALDLLGRALKVNPLDRRLRGKINSAHLHHARSHAEAGRFGEARGEYQAALAGSDGPDRYTVLCKWAACEFKAGASARAEELLAQARAEGGGRLPIAYSLLIDAVRLKLSRPVKKRFDDEFKAALAEPPIPGSAVQVAEIIAAHRGADITYYGQKTHEKKVQAYLEKALRTDLGETQLERIAASLMGCEALALARKFTSLGGRRFPDSPFFPFIEAETHMLLGPERCPIWKVTPLLEDARRLASARSQSERERQLLELIEDRQRTVAALNPFGAGGFFEDLDRYEDEDEDDSYDDDW